MNPTQPRNFDIANAGVAFMIPVLIAILIHCFMIQSELHDIEKMLKAGTDSCVVSK